MIKWIKREIKQHKCIHVYFDTGEETRNPISGGYRNFHCPKCGKEKGVYIPEINNVYEHTDYVVKMGIASSTYYANSKWKQMSIEKIRELLKEN